MFLKALYDFSLTDRIAHYDGNESLSFTELWKRSENVACILIEKYPSKNPVVIYGDKENDMLSCMLGAMKAGKPYVCIPNYYPVQRLSEIIEDCHAEVIFSPSNILPEYNGLEIFTSEDIRKEPKFEVSKDYYVHHGDHICYIYTSGSTGKPKGVIISYDNLIEKIKCTRKGFDGTTTDRGIEVNLSPYSFSASLGFVYTILFLGNPFYGIHRSIIANLDLFIETLVEINPVSFFCTPSLMEKLLTHEKFSGQHITKLYNIVVGGEALTVSLINKIKKSFPKSRLVNAYGSTESSSVGFFVDVTNINLENEEIAPVGEINDPFSYIGDDDGEPLSEEGAIGEIIPHGQCVSVGYLNHPELNENVFFVNKNGERAYHTGDLAQIRNGYYYYIGRKDNQVKIGGNRVEFEEVEANMKKIEIVQDCAVTVRTDSEGVNTLVAFVVKSDKNKSDASAFLEIKGTMKKTVQFYLIPSKIIFMDSLPKNANMKIDRALLKKMAQESK